MNSRVLRNVSIMFALIVIVPNALSRPIDNLDAECNRTGAVSLVVRNPNTGERFVYYCETRQLDPCPGNVCQSDERIEVEPDCDAFPWDQGCTGDRFPECPADHHWDPAKKKCVLACGADQVQTYQNGRWTCESLPSGGSPSGSGPSNPPPKPKTCMEAADKYCQQWFSVSNLKTIAGECYTAEECRKKITDAEAEEMRSPTAQCKLCIDNNCKGLPDGRTFRDDQYCDASLDIAVGRLADYWKAAKKVKKNPPTEADVRNECRRDPELCGRRQNRPPDR